MRECKHMHVMQYIEQIIAINKNREYATLESGRIVCYECHKPFHFSLDSATGWETLYRMWEIKE